MEDDELMGGKAVLITGAGPTGLTMANLLAGMDIPFLLIDKKPQPSRDSKAFGIHARTLEIFDQLGIAEKAVEEGYIDNTIHWFIKKKEAAHIRIKEILPGESRYPYFLVLQQDKTERLLIEALEERRQKVLWQHELSYFEENGEGIKATIKGPDGQEVHAPFQYLIGCDGAGSTVRAQAGISFKGKTFSDTFYLADVELEGDLTHGDIYFFFAPYYITGLFSFPEQNKFRIFSFMNPAVGKEEGAELSQEEVQKILDSNPYHKIKIKKQEWSSLFKIHMRYTDTFQKGRIFLAGDAAHVHTPAGGQGMNTGIQDAYNLAWKLGLVINGKAGKELLHTYNEERRPIAINLHNTTDRFFHLLTRRGRLANFLRLHLITKMAAEFFRIKRFRINNFRRVSQLAIKYRYSSLSKDGAGKVFSRKAPKAGDRAPFCRINKPGYAFKTGEATNTYKLFKPTHFTLFIVTAKPYSLAADRIHQFFSKKSRLPMQLIKIKGSPAEEEFFKVYGIQKEAIFIIRPDTHIGFRSSRLNIQEIEHYLEGCHFHSYDDAYLTKRNSHA